MDSKLLNKIKSEFISGAKTLQEAADEYNVPYSTLTKKSHAEKWKTLRKECGKKTERKIVDAVSNIETKKAVDIIDVADKLLDKITEYIDTIPLSAQAVKQLTSAIKDIKEIKGIKSKADEREQEARIKNLEKMAEKGQQDDNGTGILILPSITDMSTPPRENE